MSAFLATDRCDRCGAQAYVRTRHGASELLWCGHHLAEHELALVGCIVDDERASLTPTA